MLFVLNMKLPDTWIEGLYDLSPQTSPFNASFQALFIDFENCCFTLKIPFRNSRGAITLHAYCTLSSNIFLQMEKTYEAKPSLFWTEGPLEHSLNIWPFKYTFQGFRYLPPSLPKYLIPPSNNRYLWKIVTNMYE